MASKVLVLIVLTAVIAAAAVAIDPALDLRIAASFQTPGAAAAIASWRPWLEIWRDCNFVLAVAFAGVAAGTIVIKMISPRRWTLMSARTAMLVLSTFVLGPVLLVNGVLKPYSGRPRPGAVAELGGAQPFVQWWDWRGECDGNCSFVSGEASEAYALLAPAVVAPPPWRPVAIGAVLVYGTAVGVMRMAMGGHFATDIVFAGVFTALIVWLLHGSAYRWKRTRLTEDEAEQFLGRGGAKIRAMPARFRRVAASRER